MSGTVFIYKQLENFFGRNYSSFAFVKQKKERKQRMASLKHLRTQTAAS